jgi:hypothetical protein
MGTRAVPFIPLAPATERSDCSILCHVNATHRVMFWHLAGALDLDPELAPTAPATTLCGRCQGTGPLTQPVPGGCATYPTPVACRACHGAGAVAPPLAA